MKLPLEYSKLAEFFDIMSDNNPLNTVLGSILKPLNVSSILDFSAGTGSQVEYLENRGYKIIGVDYSPALVKMGKANGLNLFEGDMRSSYFGQFDAVITMGRSIGHLTSEDFARAISNIGRNLNDKGLYIFDNFNFDALTDDVVTGLSMDYVKLVEGKSFRHKQYSQLNRNSKLLTSFDEFILPDRTEWGSFDLKTYTMDEIEKLLKDNGFKLIQVHSREGSTFERISSQSFIAVARKV